MKIIDTRDRTTLQGEFVTVLPANEPVSEADMKRYYKTLPGASMYDALSRPCPYERVVLKHGDPEDQHYYIVPRYEFYRIEYDV